MVRARLFVAVIAALALTVTVGEARAQDVAPDRLDVSTVDFKPALMDASAVASMRLPNLEQLPPVVPFRQPVVPVRPKSRFGGTSLLNSLYASTVVMQGLDVHSTLSAFKAGAGEGNPIMAGVTKNRAAFVATKAAVAAATIFAVKKIAKKNKVAAVITLVVVNAAYALVVKHNYDMARRR
jgi:hypothetical protein